MKSLLISLVLVVVFSVFGLGWLATQIYLTLHDSEFDSDNSSIGVYQKVGENLAEVLDTGTADFDNIVDDWPGKSDLKLTLSPSDLLPLPPSLLEKFLQGETLILEEDKEISLSFYLVNTQQVLALSIPKYLVIQNSNSGLLLTLMFYLGIIAVLLIWLYPLLNRLMLLQKAAKEVGSGNLDVRIKKSRWSYISDIEKTFNIMADRIQSLISDNKLLSRAVSHDLKTPLARLRFGVETLEEAETEKQRSKYRARIKHDLDEMESLVNTLLQYSKLDDVRHRLNIKPVNLNVLLSQIIEEYESSAKNIKLLFDSDDVYLDADKSYLRMLINNLLSNAVNYCESTVIIRTSENEGNVQLSVEDDGPGISESDHKKVFLPFIRGENTQGRSGHGMGLAIVAKIVEWHKAKIRLDYSKELKGAEIKISF